MELITPSIKYQESYIAALKEGFYAGSQAIKTDAEIAEIAADFNKYLATKLLKPYDATPRLRDDGKYYPNAPQIKFWLVEGDKFIGEFNLRTELNDFLMYVGGNVGYGIRPSERQKGYATQGLKLLIEEARQRGMKKLLIAAKSSNIGSWKAIEKNDGRLENIITLPWKKDSEEYKRYWIEIK